MMRRTVTFCICLLTTLAFSQGKVNSGVYKFGINQMMISGETTHFQDLQLSTMKLDRNDSILDKAFDNKEQIFIVKQGKVEVTIGNETKIIGASSVAFVLPKDQIKIKNNLETPAILYHMLYSSKDELDLKRGKDNAGSFIINFTDLEYNQHDRGGIRNYFNTKTATLNYYEMHVTNLNGGIKSHEPHTHRAAEIVLMIDGDTQMEIGDKIYKANVGDIYFLASNIPHAIQNIGSKQAIYFAFQWD